MKATSLRVNDAQMRTRCSREKMIQLAVSIKSAGLDPTQPIIVGALENHTRQVISGHRRWLALMIATFMEEATPKEAARVIKEKLNPKDGFISLDNEVYYKLAAEVDIEISCQIFEGNSEEMILTLLRAGGGAEEPDLLGLSHAFNIALNEGINERRLAANNGLSLTAVRSIIALSQIDPRIAQKIQDGVLGLSACRPILSLPTPQCAAMVEAIIDKKHDGISTKRVVKAVRTLKAFKGFSANLESTKAAQNQTLALQCLWDKSIEDDAEITWSIAAKEALNYRSLTGTRWLTQLDNPDDRRFTLQRASYYPVELDPDALAAMVPELTCETCLLKGLPEERLHRDLELPCRRKTWTGHGCFNHRPSEPLKYSLPWYWHGKAKIVKTMKELLKAWRAQKRYEDKTVPVTGKDIQAQRNLIRRFMESCELPQFHFSHPWATRCSTCKWHLDQSPTKNPDLPYCQWADRRRRIDFKVRVPTDGPGMPIPLCRQYAPANDDWKETLPESKQALAFPRSVILDIVGAMASDAHGHDRRCLEFLVGRPLRSKDKGRRFEKMLKKRIGDLSDGQLQTLFTWLTCEWLRVRRHWSTGSGTPIPVTTGYARYNEMAFEAFLAKQVK